MTESHMPRQSHGIGEFQLADLCALGQGVVFEPGVLVLHPEIIERGKYVYIGYHTILQGYYKNKLS